MQETTLLKISIITAILGLVFLFFYSQQLDFRTVETLDQAFLKESVTIKGKIETITVTEKATFLKVSGSRIDTVEVILFPKEKIALAEGDIIEITGKVEEYNGKKEIIADSVSKLKVVID